MTKSVRIAATVLLLAVTPVAAQTVSKPDGKPVTFYVGSKYKDLIEVSGIARVVDDSCPVRIVEGVEKLEGVSGSKRRLTVQIDGGEMRPFRDAGAAGSYAETHCRK